MEPLFDSEVVGVDILLYFVDDEGVAPSPSEVPLPSFGCQGIDVPRTLQEVQDETYLRHPWWNRPRRTIESVLSRNRRRHLLLALALRRLNRRTVTGRSSTDQSQRSTPAPQEGLWV